MNNLNIKHRRKERIVRAMNSPTIAGTVVSANGPVESESTHGKVKESFAVLLSRDC